ncbi:MAG: O-antigen ligase family protein [Rubrobacteraceae bacterium]|nr:O-antigen ligase family protein [Rubrobacteraceae bacterium]
MSNLFLFMSDPVTLALLILLFATLFVPAIILTLGKVASLPVHTAPFRTLYFAWAALLAGSSVWNLSREVRHSINQAGVDNYVRLLFLVVGLMTILFLATRYRFGFASGLIRGVIGIYFVFALWGGLSTFWSVYPGSTLYKSFEYLVMVLLFALSAFMVSEVVRGPSNRMLALKSIFDWNWFLVFASLVMVYVGVAVWPSYALMPSKGVLPFSLQGALPAIAANGVGQLSAILGVVALARLIMGKSRLLYGPLFVFSVLTMLLAQSRSPILAFALGALVVMIAGRKFVLLIVSAVLGAGVLLSAYAGTIYAYMDRGQSTGELDTLTGRTVFWKASLEAARHRWLTGYGANAGGRYILDNNLSISDISTVHSTYVETLIDTGVIGSAILLVGLGVVWVSIVKLRRTAAMSPISKALWVECLGVMMVLSVRSIFSVVFVWSSTVLIFGVVLVFVTVMGREAGRRRADANNHAAQLLSAQRRRRSGVYR